MTRSSWPSSAPAGRSNDARQVRGHRCHRHLFWTVPRPGKSAKFQTDFTATVDKVRADFGTLSDETGTVMTRKGKLISLIAVLASALLVAIPVTGQAQQQENPVELDKKANELQAVGKYAEAIPFARR